MRSFALVVASSLLLTPAAPALAAPEPPTPEALAAAAAAIRDVDCKAHVDFLASDLLEGRSTPSRGLDLAGAYIVSHFERFGLEPGGDEGTWLQAFPIIVEARLKTASFSVDAGSTVHELELGTDFAPLSLTGSGRAEGAAVVFAGYGITAPEESYDDYEGVDVKGKVVLILRHEPREQDDGDAFAGRRNSRHAFYQRKVENAARRGAKAIFIVTDPKNHEDADRRPEVRWPIPFADDVGDGDFPAFQVSPGAAKALLGGRDLLEIQKKIDDALAPQSFEVEGVRASLAVEVEKVTGYGKNVVGVLRGSDPTLKAEAVVIGAHYDHVGVQAEDGHGFPGQIGPAVKGDRIHNGADDNASGTAGLIEVAKAFAQSGARPRRTIVFIAFAGEELGLLGSRFYTRKPPIPIKQTVAMINLDMIGRNDPNRVNVLVPNEGALARAFESSNGVIGMEIRKMSSRGMGGGSSDHASFQRVGVPAMFFFAGDHPDYHRVTDHSSGIVVEKIQRIARLAYMTAAHVADDEGAEKPKPPTRLF